MKKRERKKTDKQEMEEVIRKLEWERFSLPSQRNINYILRNRRRGPVSVFRTFRHTRFCDTGTRSELLDEQLIFIL